MAGRETNPYHGSPPGTRISRYWEQGTIDTLGHEQQRYLHTVVVTGPETSETPSQLVTGGPLDPLEAPLPDGTLDDPRDARVRRDSNTR